MYNILGCCQKKKFCRDYFNRTYIPKRLREKIIRTPFESSYKFACGALNRSCRINTAHERQWVSAVLSTMDFADFSLLKSCIFGTEKKHSTDKSLCYVFGVPDRSRTCDLRSRSPTLYPTELRIHYVYLLYQNFQKKQRVFAHSEKFFRMIITQVIFYLYK